MIPRQRNAGPGAFVEVGRRRGSGSVRAELVFRSGEVRLAVNVAHLTGMTVDVDLVDARILYEGLGRLLGAP